MEEDLGMECEWSTVKRKREANYRLENENIKKRREIQETPINKSKVSNNERIRKERDMQIQIDSGDPGASHLGFVETHTMQSEDDLVIVIQPIGENALSFTRDPIGLAVGIKNSNFNRVNIKSHRVNSRANRVAIELEREEIDKISELLETNQIGKWAVKCHRPNKNHRVYGVIKGVDQSVSIEDLMKEMDSCDKEKVSKMQRMPRFVNKTKEESTAIKIEFLGINLPPKIKIAYTVYKVFEYNPPPMRCYNCQRLGHQANNCTAKPRCLICSGPHKKQVCKINTEEKYKCANCNGNHIASSKKCYAIQNASIIMQQIRMGKTFEEAKKFIINRNQQQVNPVSDPNNTYSPTINNLAPRTSVADMQQEKLSGSEPRTNQQTQEHLTKHLGQSDVATVVANNTQQGTSNLSYREATYSTALMEKSEQSNSNDGRRETNSLVRDNCYDSYIKQQMKIIENSLERKMNAAIERVIENFRKILENQILKFQQGLIRFVTELLSTNLEVEGTEQRKLLLVSTIRNTLGSNISEPLLDKLIKEKKQGEKQDKDNNIGIESAEEFSTEYETEQEVSNQSDSEKRTKKNKQTNNITKNSLRNSQKKNQNKDEKIERKSTRNNNGFIYS